MLLSSRLIKTIFIQRINCAINSFSNIYIYFERPFFVYSGIIYSCGKLDTKILFKILLMIHMHISSSSSSSFIILLQLQAMLISKLAFMLHTWVASYNCFCLVIFLVFQIGIHHFLCLSYKFRGI